MRLQSPRTLPLWPLLAFSGLLCPITALFEDHQQLPGLVCVCEYVFSHGQLFVTPWTVAHGSSVHRISQARILEWITISSSSGSSQPRDHTRVSHVSCTGRQILYHWAAWVAHWATCKSVSAEPRTYWFTGSKSDYVTLVALLEKEEVPLAKTPVVIKSHSSTCIREHQCLSQEQTSQKDSLIPGTEGKSASLLHQIARLRIKKQWSTGEKDRCLEKGDGRVLPGKAIDPVGPQTDVIWEAYLSRKILHEHQPLDHMTPQYAKQDCQCLLRIRK